MFACLFVLCFFLRAAFSVPLIHHLYSSPNGEYRIVKDERPDAVRMFTLMEAGALSQSMYSQDINQTGWAYFEIHTNNGYSDEVQAYSAGYIEGYLTHDLIYQHWYNTLGDYCNGKQELCDKIDDYVNKNLEWVNLMINQTNSTDPYWYQVMLFYKQIEGLADGYIHANNDSSTALTKKDILWMNLQGDFEDLENVFNSQEGEEIKAGKVEKNGKVLGQGHCSALIKVLNEGKDLFVAQDTWSTYQSMLRFQKKYMFPFMTKRKSYQLIRGLSMTFSSYPGVITSGDDFYVILSGLVTLETTIGNSNSSLWKYVNPVGQVSEGVRTMVANRLANSGKSWSKIFTMYNSGTYNNQWMVVDYKRFKKGTPISELHDNLLWVLEQLPGYTHAEDMTRVLRSQSYWPSYNVAAFKDVFNLSGNQVLVEKYGDWFTYERNPRALIFKRDHGKVHDLKSMMSLMRYNDFMHDPLSRCNCTPPYSAENAIAARCDLNPANGTYPFGALGHRSHGATDAKITSTDLSQTGLRFLAVSGPVYNTDKGLPPFQWSKADFESTTPHLGHPDLWKFEPIIHKWS